MTLSPARTPLFVRSATPSLERPLQGYKNSSRAEGWVRQLVLSANALHYSSICVPGPSGVPCFC